MGFSLRALPGSSIAGASVRTASPRLPRYVSAAAYGIYPPAERALMAAPSLGMPRTNAYMAS